MKTSRLLIFIGFVAAIVALVWQAKTISQLRAEVGGLRKDLQTSLESALDNAAGLPLEAAEARREKLELIKLRHQVRELNESAVGSHARERMANVRTVMHSLWPTSATSGPWKFRPEWKGMEAQATNQYAQAMGALASATNDYVRFLCLGSAAKMSLVVGRTEDARQFATDMLLLDDKYTRGNSEKANGDVVYNGHLVLGRIALDDGRIEEAKRHLLAAGKSKGSPVLGSFGPNMSLAKDLLDKGEQEAVLQYLELCRKFWGSGGGKLDEWIKDIHEGRVPDFGANLIY
jgi:hypothetical protein